VLLLRLTSHLLRGAALQNQL